jgi:hypothetical protein
MTDSLSPSAVPRPDFCPTCTSPYIQHRCDDLWHDSPSPSEGSPASAAPRLEIIETLKELEEFISELASSAMLSGEEFPEEDKGAFYSEACKAKNKLTWLIDELAPGAAPSQESPAK